MFSVIISEKGGAERRESFDRTEINVGRVQGNDLMLPKGNVSKRHARLLFRDGRFIVTDLKSTNGTYVNGRKIAQATIVREGDKIYIGDFVLRIEAAGGSSAGAAPVGDDAPPPQQQEFQSSEAMQPPAPIEHESSAERALAKPGAPRIDSKPAEGGRSQEVISHFPLEQDPDESVPYQVPAAPRVPSTPDPGMPAPPAMVAPMMAPGAPPRPATTAMGMQPPQQVARPTNPAPPPMVQPGRVASVLPAQPSAPPPMDLASPASPVASPPIAVPPPQESPQRVTAPSVGVAPRPFAPEPAASTPPIVGAAQPAFVPPRPSPASAVPIAAPLTPQPQAASSMPPATAAVSSPRRAPAAEPARASAPEVAAHRAALALLADRVGEAVDLTKLHHGADEALVARIDAALLERSHAIRAAGEVAPETDLDAIAGELRRELLELGPLTSLFEDEDVSEIHVMRHDYVLAMHGRRQVPMEVGFTSEIAVERVLRRLCRAAGKPLEPSERFVERRLPRGGRLFAVMPEGADQGHMLVIRKPQRADLTLEDLVRGGTISRAMAGLFSQCVTARANLLVTGTIGAGTTSLLGALAAAGSTEDRVIVLQEDDELIFNQPHTISILLGDTPADNARAVQAAARARPDRLVVGAFAGTVAAEMVDAMGDGVDGVLAAARAPTLRQAVSRLAADLAATRPGLPIDTAREWLASAFDLAIEIARLRDGRHRVLRVGELAVENDQIVIKDVFNFAIERTAAGGAIEGSFHATGHVPGVVEDLSARGVSMDSAIFKRPAAPAK